MAGFGNNPVDRGTLDVRATRSGLIQGYFLPKESPATGTGAADRLAAGVKLIEVDPPQAQLTM